MRISDWSSDVCSSDLIRRYAVLLRQEHGVPADLVGCHMLLIDGYVVEGHVSAATVKRLLAERPAIRGIAMPGMPTGVPGMPGPKEGPIEVFRSEEHTSELQSLLRISYAVFCFKKTTRHTTTH